MTFCPMFLSVEVLLVVGVVVPFEEALRPTIGADEATILIFVVEVVWIWN